jgi:hypothetical protein
MTVRGRVDRVEAPIDPLDSYVAHYLAENGDDRGN